MVSHRNRGFRWVFDDGLTVGLFFPIPSAEEPISPMEAQVTRCQLATSVGFDALWFRDVPLYWPKFRDAGQVYDPWVYLTHIAAHTDDVALATGSIVLPLRHPLHVAKAAASIDQLSGGRLVLGIASGDRPPEFGAFGIEEDDRGERFREAVDVLRTVWRESFPEIESSFGRLDGSLDLVPKPTTETLPLMVTGHARQSVDWIGEHGDGWLYYRVPEPTLESMLADWRDVAGNKPFIQGMGIELLADSTAGMEHIHQGYRAGSEWVRDHIATLADHGVDHLAISLRSTDRDIETVIEEFGEDVLGAL
ncbi:MAG: LLM class oxidoreductase [Halobacteriales archaeon]